MSKEAPAQPSPSPRPVSATPIEAPDVVATPKRRVHSGMSFSEYLDADFRCPEQFGSPGVEEEDETYRILFEAMRNAREYTKQLRAMVSLSPYHALALAILPHFTPARRARFDGNRRSRVLATIEVQLTRREGRGSRSERRGARVEG